MSPLNRTSAAMWKGLAIWAVVLVHWLAVFPDSLYFDSSSYWWSVPFQSVVRLSVPLFLALSGYGLAKKYAQKKITWPDFLIGRLGKLLPLYVLWSIIIALTLELNPQWRIMPIQPLWQQLLLGTADYQLYFVPLILQFYVLFPLFHRLKENQLQWLTVFALMCQVVIALLLRWSWFHPGFIPIKWLDDQFQYRFLFNWWGYFLLGQVFAITKTSWLQKEWFKKGILLFIVASLIWATFDSRALLQSTQNVIFGTSFLRVPVITFAVGGIFLALNHNLGFLPKHLASSLASCGQHSFLIFLAHTTLLRIFFTLCLTERWTLATSTSFLLSVLLTLLAILVSLFFISGLPFPWQSRK